MDSLPAEIWEHVFQFACSDNGFTGRSLSLVSKRMNDIVKPYKLRSISVVGGAQIIKFSEFLNSISESSSSSAAATTTSSTSTLLKTATTTSPQTTIQNLFIGITNPRLFPPLTTSSDLLLRSALNSLHLSNDSSNSQLRSRDVDGLDMIIVKAVHRILKLLSPTLHTLHLHFVTTFGTTTTLSSSTPFPFSFPMPRLSELTIYGPLFNSRTGGGDISSTISWLTVFPSLKRLRMGNYQAFQGLPTDFLPRLAISMPRLTHISLFQPLPSMHHVHSLGRLIMSPGTFWSGLELEKMIIEVDVSSVLFEGTTNNGVDHGESREPLVRPWLENLRNCVHQTADTRVCLIETRRSWVDVETAQIEWSQRNMGMRWVSSFRARHSVLRSSGSFSEE